MIQSSTLKMNYSRQLDLVTLGELKVKNVWSFSK